MFLQGLAKAQRMTRLCGDVGQERKCIWRERERVCKRACGRNKEEGGTRLRVRVELDEDGDVR
jgi:hypothetical protein